MSKSGGLRCLISFSDFFFYRGVKFKLVFLPARLAAWLLAAIAPPQWHSRSPLSCRAQTHGAVARLDTRSFAIYWHLLALLLSFLHKAALQHVETKVQQ